MPTTKTGADAPHPNATDPQLRSETTKTNEAKRRPGATRKAALKLLRRAQGVTLAELTKVTGWQPHSSRAIISGLRKEGLAIVRTKRGEHTCYKIEEQG